MEFTLLWAALTAVAAAWLGTRVWRASLPDSPTERIVSSAAAGLLVGRIAEMIGQGINPITNLSDLLIIRGGVSVPAATVAAIGTLWWTSNRDLSVVDSFSAPALVGLAGWHAGCLWRSACLGTVSDLPWALAEPGSTITRHPVELYAAVGLVLASLLVSRIPPKPGLRSAAALGLAALVRLVTEPFRLSVTGGPVFWYVAGLSLALLAGTALVWRQREI